MLKSKALLIDRLKKLHELVGASGGVARQVLGKEFDAHLQRIQGTLDQIAAQELIVPVVGSFSAGKSSLINALIGEQLLPVAITPETALPTELRFADEEWLHAVRNDGKEERYLVSDLRAVQERAAEYALIRLYLNRQRLRELEPLILVDMPGFNSPLDQHNKAIDQYLARGAHYLFVMSVEEGALHMQAVERMEEVATLNRHFSVAVNKVDLRPASDVSRIVDYVQGQLEDRQLAATVTAVSQSKTQDVQQVLKGLDAEGLFEHVTGAAVEEVVLRLSDALATAERAFQRSLEDNAEELAQLQTALDEVKAERDVKLCKARDADPTATTDAVLAEVAQAVSTSAAGLATRYLRAPDDFQRLLSEIVRGTLLRALMFHTDNISAQALQDFSQRHGCLQGIQIQLGDDWMEIIGSKLQDILPMLLSEGTMSIVRSSAKALGVAARVGKVAPNPIVSIALQALPLALNLMTLNAKTRQAEQAQEAIRHQVVPAICAELRAPVDTLLLEFHATALQALSDTLNATLEDQKSALQARSEYLDVEGLADAVTAVQQLQARVTQLFPQVWRDRIQARIQ